MFKLKPPRIRLSFSKPVLILLGVFFLSFLIATKTITFNNPLQTIPQFLSKNTPKAVQAAEIVEMKKLQDVKLQSVLYKKLIDRVGPEQAQDELLNSGLPFDGQTHLLNHTVGDWLYEKYGNEGLVKCKDYFLSSCYHGFLIHFIADKGVDGLPTVMDICQKSGRPVVSQCAHAIGHGFLTFHGYPELTKALKSCDNLETQWSGFPVFNCHDGVFMENVWGVHDGQPSPDRWIKDNDPLYPCNDPRIDEKYINACWAEQPTVMYQQFKGDIKRVGEECNKVTNPTYKVTCFDAVARQIHPIVKGSVDETFKQCNLMPSDWRNPCVLSIVRSFFSVGDKQTPFIICDRIDQSAKDQCQQTLVDFTQFLSKTEQERQTLCNRLTDSNYKDRCLNYQPVTN